MRARIIDAAARLLQEQGPAAVTTHGVAQAAGVQAPAIYRSSRQERSAGGRGRTRDGGLRLRKSGNRAVGVSG
jgi:hypothetical protein